jgi:hypothetical protein
MTVGAPKAPTTAGNGGFTRGWPRRPSSDSSIPVSSPHHAVAEDAALVGVLEGALEDLGGLGVLAADIDVAGGGGDRIAADGAPLDELVGVVLHQQAVLEGARLRLVGVADEVLGLVLPLRDEAPLQAGREAGAAAPAQARLLHFVDDRVGLHLERLGEPLIAAVLLVAFESQGLGSADVAGQDRLERNHHFNPFRICRTRLGVRFS